MMNIKNSCVLPQRHVELVLLALSILLNIFPYSLSSNFRPIDVSYLPHVPPTSSPSVSRPSITKFYERQPRQPPDVNLAVDPSPSLDHPPGNVSIEPLILRCSTRISKPPERHSIYACFTAQDHVSVLSSYSQAQKDPCW